MKHSAKTKVDLNDASPSWETGPNPIEKPALDEYGQAVCQIKNGNRYVVTGGHNNRYQGGYQMDRDALADVGFGLIAGARDGFGLNSQTYMSAVRSGLAAGQAQLGDNNGT